MRLPFLAAALLAPKPPSLLIQREGRGETTVLVVIVVQRNSQLLQVVLAHRPRRTSVSAVHSW